MFYATSTTHATCHTPPGCLAQDTKQVVVTRQEKPGGDGGCLGAAIVAALALLHRSGSPGVAAYRCGDLALHRMWIHPRYSLPFHIEHIPFTCTHWLCL